MNGDAPGLSMSGIGLRLFALLPADHMVPDMNYVIELVTTSPINAPGTHDA